MRTLFPSAGIPHAKLGTVSDGDRLTITGDQQKVDAAIAELEAEKQPLITADSGWVVTNHTSDKVYDADSTSLNELSDVVGSMITALISLGLFSA